MTESLTDRILKARYRHLQREIFVRMGIHVEVTEDPVIIDGLAITLSGTYATALQTICPTCGRKWAVQFLDLVQLSQLLTEGVQHGCECSNCATWRRRRLGAGL